MQAENVRYVNECAAGGSNVPSRMQKIFSVKFYAAGANVTALKGFAEWKASPGTSDQDCARLGLMLYDPSAARATYKSSQSLPTFGSISLRKSPELTISKTSDLQMRENCNSRDFAFSGRSELLFFEKVEWNFCFRSIAQEIAPISSRRAETKRVSAH
jgi:hypothetical protein